MNTKNPAADFFWLPILLLKGLWFLVKLMFLGIIHTADARECERMMYVNPKKVSYSARKGVELCHLGQYLFVIVSCLLLLVLLALCNAG